jgi:predicted site-specific integrase-resolvase
MSEKYIRPEDACRILKITNRTLYNWDVKGLLKNTKTKGGHRRYLLSDVIEKSGGKQESPPDERRKICYCRVSTRGQKEDLERQIQFFKERYPDYEIISDYGSGINFKRKGFNSILESAIKGNIREVVVTHKDRLCRFGFELVERIITQDNKGKIVVLDKQETSPQEELVSDLISIITVFSSRIYGLRSNSIKKQIRDQTTKNSEDSSLSNGEREEADSIGNGTIQVVL